MNAVFVRGISLALCLSTSIFAQSVNANVLKAYSRVDEVIPLPEVGGNLSGITYNSDTNTYFLIQNNYGKIFEYDRSFKAPLRTIQMLNLIDKDTEDIVYLGSDRFAISTEENHILIFSITPGQTTVDMNLARADVQGFTLPAPKKDNKGLEGVCFNPKSTTGRGTFYAVQEQKPKRIFSFTWPRVDIDFGSSRGFGLTEPYDADALLKHRLSDLSACTVDAESGHLLLLSHESSRLMELSPTGQILQMLEIPAVASQYEGVTFGPDRELVLVSEPNVLVIMKKNL